MSHLLPRLTPIVLMILLVTAGDLVLPSWRAPALAAPSTCATPVALTNGDFESPVISTGSVNIMA